MRLGTSPCFHASPSSWKAICSEQRCFCPLLEIWQCALTQARTRVSGLSGFAAIRMARNACWRVIFSTNAVFARSECSAALKMTRFSRDARVAVS